MTAVYQTISGLTLGAALSLSVAQAGVIGFEGSASGTLVNSAVPFSVSFEGEYDDAMITGVDFEFIKGFDILSSFTLAPNPPTGQAGSFNLSNTGVQISFVDGALQGNFVLSGNLAFTAATDPDLLSRLSANTDAFNIIFPLFDGAILSPLSGSLVTLPGGFDFFEFTQQQFQVTGPVTPPPPSPVPVSEPGALALLGLGLFGLGLAKRREQVQL